MQYAALLYSSCIMKMISNFTIFFIFQIIVSKFFFINYNRLLNFNMIPAVLLLMISFFIFKINYLNFLKDSQNFFIQTLPLHTSCLFSMLLNDNIVDIGKSDGICLPTFVVNEFSALFLHQSVFSINI